MPTSLKKLPANFAGGFKLPVKRLDLEKADLDYKEGPTVDNFRSSLQQVSKRSSNENQRRRSSIKEGVEQS